MNLSQRLFYAFGFCLLSALTGLGQVADNTYTANGFTFNYPADWKVSNTSSGNVQQFRLSPSTGNGVIIVSSPNVKVSNYLEFQQIRTQTSDQFFESIYQRFARSGLYSVKVGEHCEEVRNTIVPGQRITGFYDQVPTTADFTYFVFQKRFFALIGLRDNSITNKISDAQALIAKTLAVTKSEAKFSDFMLDAGHEGVINGKAIKLPHPVYPSTNYKGSGNVKIHVSIVIDEDGNVISASGLAGSVIPQGGMEFLGVAQAAARQAKFSPTLMCGKPTRVYGTIEYDFTR